MTEIIKEDSSTEVVQWGYASDMIVRGSTTTHPTDGYDMVLLQDDRSLPKCNPKDQSGFRAPSSYYRTISTGYCYGPAFTASCLWYSGGGSQFNRNTWVGKCNYDCNTSPVTVPLRLKALAEQRALQKVLNQNFNVGTFMAEMPETAEMIAKHAGHVFRAMKHIVHFNPKALARDLKKAFPKGQLLHERVGKLAFSKAKTPAQLWLEAQYGIKPLVTDVYGAIADVERRASDYPPRIDVKGKAYEYTPSFFKNGQCNASYCLFDIMESGYKLFGYTVHLTYGVSCPWLFKAAQMGIVNPSEWVWEALPGSFIVDWFLPVGNWLQSLTATAGLNFIAGSYTSFSKREGEWILSPTSWQAAEASVYIYGDKFRRMSMDRRIYTNSPIPNLWHLANPWGLHGKRVANAAALGVANINNLKSLTPLIGKLL